jgi:hypothetical protein
MLCRCIVDEVKNGRMFVIDELYVEEAAWFSLRHPPGTYLKGFEKMKIALGWWICGLRFTCGTSSM